MDPELTFCPSSTLTYPQEPRKSFYLFEHDVFCKLEITHPVLSPSQTYKVFQKSTLLLLCVTLTEEPLNTLGHGMSFATDLSCLS